MALARLVMQSWGENFSRILKKNNIGEYLRGIYVDDGRNIIDILSNGIRYEKEKEEFVYNEDWREDDEKSGISQEKRTEIEIRNLMNSINPDLQFTTERETDFANGRLPTLSFQLWSECEGLRHSYFEKEMRTQVLTMQQSSQGENSKISILVNELMRRFEVMDEKLERSEEIGVIDHFTCQLKNSGYIYKQAREIVISALKGNQRKRENRKGENKRYRSGEETIETRLNKKLLEASTWFKDREKENYEKKERENIENNLDEEKYKEKNKSWKEWRKFSRREKNRIMKNIKGVYRKENIKELEKEKRIEGVMFIQHTQHSELARNIRERLKVIENVGTLKIKLVERTGDKLVDLLHKSNAWGNEDCQRPDCWPCKSAGEEGPKGSCRQRSVMYETYCELCGEKCKENEENKLREKIEETEKTSNKRKRDSKKVEKNRKDYKVKYIGETWRTAYERGSEHQEDVKNLKENSHILKHIIEVHPGRKIEEVKFGMRVIRKFNSALERQVNEAVSIHQAQRDGYTLLNSKSEYSRCTVPRLKVETNEELLEKLLGEKESDKVMKERIRNLKKRKKDPLSTICEEIIIENNKK